MKDVIKSTSTKKEVKNMKKALVILMAISMLFAMGSMALAAGDIDPNEYDLTIPQNGNPAKDYRYFEEGVAVTSGAYNGSTPSAANDSSTHPYGTWNSPFTAGVDGYNYNDAQDYIAKGAQFDQNTGAAVTGATAAADIVFASGPHGGYLTSTHRCRECHAVHRAAGKFKLLRSDTRFEACDWCHGTGAGSGYNIQMDNDVDFTTEYNVGHTMGFGVSTGKWKAPDDTYPAFTPNYWQGGFSCFDCHSPHANPSRMLGFNDAGDALGIAEVADSSLTQASQVPTGRVFGIVNSGGDDWAGTLVKAKNPQRTNKPFWLSGSWLLIKNPDREIASTTTAAVSSGVLTLGGTAMANIVFDTLGLPVLGAESVTTITAGQEIPDYITANLFEFDSTTSYPVNKIPIDWDSPMGNARTLWKVSDTLGVTTNYLLSNGKPAGFLGFNVRRSEALRIWEDSGTASPVDKFIENYDGTSSQADVGVPCNVWSVSDFCTDCHDGNAGKHTIQAPLFSEDRALRSGTDTPSTADYDLAYGHDVQPRH
ncbi:MAG TPA: hypothetical protein DE036_04925 [Actinobacteria bacterium]|nr:hypothetical protein [Actinomycetota bacterium]